jgi:L-fuconolactonase
MMDAHVHFWQYGGAKDAWITDEMKLLKQDYLPAHLKQALDENQVRSVVAVQVDQSEAETTFLTDLAGKYPWIRGIVGWVDLRSDRVEERLNYFSQYPVIKGFRHIVQAESPGFLGDVDFLRGVAALRPFEFSYDLLIDPRQLQEAIELTGRFPEQKFILDHCAKPDIKSGRTGGWRKGIREIAGNENAYCKLSGLITEADWHAWKERDLYPYLDTLFEEFGTDRLLFGSDWPVMLLAGTYGRWKSVLEEYMGNLPETEWRKVFEENAIRFYRLAEPVPPKSVT